MDDSEMTLCVVKDCGKRGVYFARRKAVGPFCTAHCGVFIRLPQPKKDLIQVHQALGDPIDEKFADWYPNTGSNNRIKLENVRIK